MHEKFAYEALVSDLKETSLRLVLTPWLLLLWASFALGLFVVGRHLFHFTLENSQ